MGYRAVFQLAISLVVLLLNGRSGAQLAVPLGDLAPGLSDRPSPSAPRRFTSVGGRAAFIADVTSDTSALFVSEPDGSGAREVARFASLPSSPIIVGTLESRVLLALGHGPDRNELWAADLDSGAMRLLHATTGTIQSASVEPLSDGAVVVLKRSGCGDCRNALLAIRGPDDQVNVIDAGPLPFFQALSPATARLGDQVLFAGNPVGLWSTDGTRAGTRRVTPVSGSPFQLVFVRLDDSVVFLAIGAGGGLGVWRTDGTAAGTIRLSTDGGDAITSLEELRGFRIGGRAIFVSGGSILSSDGTPSGSVRVRFTDGSPISGATAVGVAGARVVFRAVVNGRGVLCATDGGERSAIVLSSRSIAGVTAIRQAPDASRLVALIPVFATVPMVEGSSVSARTVVATDGTPEGTQFGDLPPNVQTGPALNTSAGLLFAGGLANGGDLTFTDGSPESLRMTADLRPSPGAGGVAFGPSVPGGVIMSVNRRLAFSDGSVAGTHLIGAVTVATTAFAFAPSDDVPAFAALPGGRVVLGGSDPAQGEGLFVTDGTEAGTRLIPGTLGLGSACWLTALGGVVYCVATDPADGRAKIYRTDGSGPGTYRVYESPTRFEKVTGFMAAGASAYFVATIEGGSTSLYRIEGESEMVSIVGLIGNTDSGSGIIGATQSTLYAKATRGPDFLYALTLETSQLSVVGTFSVYDAYCTSGACYMWDVSNDRLVEAIGNSFRVVGAPLLAGSGSSSTQSIAGAGRYIVFDAFDAEAGPELWSYDPEARTAVRLADIWPGPARGQIERLRSFGDAALFTARTPDHGRELYVTDGTPSGTRRLTDIQPGPPSSLSREVDSAAHGFARIGNLVLFGADDGVHGEEPWAVSLCLADFNSDGLTDPDDLADFIACYFASPPCPETDVNADGASDPDDLSDYITSYFNGACD